MAVNIRTGKHQIPQKPWVTVIIPCYQTEPYIYQIVKEARPLVDEVLVVDDGSTDNTVSEATKAKARVISHKVNQGKGQAMKTGAREAEGDILVFIDGDSQHDPMDIPLLLTAINEGYGLVIGSRHLQGSKALAPKPIRRITNIIASWVISFFTLMLLPWVMRRKIDKKDRAEIKSKKIKITDCTSGFRAVRKSSWNKLNLEAVGFEIETEMIYEAVKHGLSIGEVPISCHWKTSSSKLSIFKDGYKTVKMLIRKLVKEIRNE